MLTIEWDADTAAAEFYLDELASSLGDMESPMRKVGFLVLQEVRDRFEAGANAAGVGTDHWVRLTNKWWLSEEKQESSYPDDILKLTGDLYYSSIDPQNIEADRNSVVFEIQHTLAGIHGEGDGRMPARPLFDRDDAFDAEVHDIFVDWLEDEKRHFAVIAGQRKYSKRGPGGRYVKRYQ